MSQTKPYRHLWRPEGWTLEIKLKKIRHMYFRVRGDRRVIEICAPLGVSRQTLEQAFLSKEKWLRGQVERCRELSHLPDRMFDSGEIHYYKGSPYPLAVREGKCRQSAFLSEDGHLVLSVRPGAGPLQRAAVLDAWYRSELRHTAHSLVKEWEPRVGKTVAEVRVRKMRTRWGSCNTRVGRIWLNIVLICMKKKFLEYVLVHEMVHLLERNHTKRFYAHMDRLLPHWPALRTEMNRFPL